MRRLPDWLYSRHTFEMQRSPRLAHRPENLLTGRFFEQTGSLGFADDYMRKYLPPALIESGAVRIIRVEHFRQDFHTAFRDFLPVESIPEQDFAVMQPHADRRRERKTGDPVESRADLPVVPLLGRGGVPLLSALAGRSILNTSMGFLGGRAR